MSYNAIAISGLPGAGKSTLIQGLKRELGWEAHGIGDYFREEYARSGVSESFEDWWPNVSLERQRELNDRARERLQEGDFILDSRYAIMNAQGLDNVLTVFVTAPIRLRAERVRERYRGKNDQEIANILRDRENSEIIMGKELFGDSFNYQNISLYGLVLDTQHMTPSEEVATVRWTLSGDTFK